MDLDYKNDLKIKTYMCIGVIHLILFLHFLLTGCPSTVKGDGLKLHCESFASSNLASVNKKFDDGQLNFAQHREFSL